MLIAKLMIKRHLWIFCALFVLLYTGCSKNAALTDEEEEDETTAVESASDYTWDATKVVHITLNGTSITVDSTGATVSGSRVTITSAGTYSISGTLSDGQIVVSTKDNDVVRLILNGASITNTTNAPIFVENAVKTVLVLADNTKNYVTDGATYTNSLDDDINAAIFSKDYLSIYGNGTLTVKANYQDGITSKDGMVIKSGTINVTAADDGIRGKDYLHIESGTFTVTSGGDGIKSDNEDGSSVGYITIDAGTFNVTSTGGDGIAAKTNLTITSGDFTVTTSGGSSVSKSTVSTKGLKGLSSVTISGGTFSINSSDDAIHSNGNINISNCTISLASSDDGIHADASLTIDSGTITITKSNEGIEGATITVNGGDIHVWASDDGFNASKGNGGESDDGSLLTINGGTIYVCPSSGDGLDSNGSLVITGGTIIVHGPQSQPDVGLDYNGTCKISGGFIIISGISSSMTQGFSTSSTQYSLKMLTSSSYTAGTLFHIQDASGNDLVTFKPEHNFSSIVFSSPSLKNGGTYYIYTGGSYSGTLTNSIYSDGTYTPGTLYSSFTVSSIVTSIGSSSSQTPGRN
jgi:hypothetical protein